MNVFDRTPVPVAQTRYDDRLRRALRANWRAGTAQLEALTRVQAVTQVVDEHAARPVVLHPDTLRIDDREPVDFGASDAVAVPPPGFDFIIECEGTVDALMEADEALTAVPPFAVHSVGGRSYLIARASISYDTEDGAESHLERLGAELREAERQLRERLDELHVEEVGYPDVDHEEVAERAVHRTAPFDEEGNGYRDTLHWFSFLQALEEREALGPFAFLLAGDKKAFGPHRHADLQG